MSPMNPIFACCLNLYRSEATLIPLIEILIRNIRSLTADKDVMFFTNDEHDEHDGCRLNPYRSEATLIPLI